MVQHNLPAWNIIYWEICSPPGIGSPVSGERGAGTRKRWILCWSSRHSTGSIGHWKCWMRVWECAWDEVEQLSSSPGLESWNSTSEGTSSERVPNCNKTGNQRAPQHLHSPLHKVVFKIAASFLIIACRYRIFTKQVVICMITLMRLFPPLTLHSLLLFLSH